MSANGFTSTSKMPPKYPTQIVLTLDAFGTLYKPREPIAKQYLAVAKQHGLLNLTLAAVEQGFRTGMITAQDESVRVRA